MTHWNYFDFNNIMSEAKARLIEARIHHHDTGEKNTLEYWIAWSTHANAVAVATLIEAGGPKVKSPRARMRKCL